MIPAVLRGRRVVGPVMALGLWLMPDLAYAHALLTLPAAIADALRTQPQVAQAAYQVTEHEDLARAARARLLPRLSLAMGSIWSESRHHQPLFIAANAPREVIGQVQVTVPLYAPQLRALATAAADQAALLRSRQRVARLAVVARVVDSYYGLDLMRTQVGIWRSTLRSVRTLYQDTQKSYAQGATSRLDLVQAQLLLRKAKGGLQQTTAQMRADTRMLNLQIGRRPRSPVDLAAQGGLPQPLPSESRIDQQARRSQPLLRVARHDIAWARAQVEIHRGARLPTVGAEAAYGVDTATVPQSGEMGWQGGLFLSMPIFGFGLDRDRIAAAQERVAALRASRQALVLQIDSQIAHDYGAARAADRIFASARRAAREAQSVYHMTREGYLAGALNGLDLAQAEGSWLRARLRLARARVQVQMTRAQLALDSGRYPQGQPSL